MTGISFRGFNWMWIPRASHQNPCNGRTKFTNERDLQLAKRLHRSEWWLTALHGKRKQPANCNFVMIRCSSNPTLSLIQWRKPTKVKTVHKVRNKDLVLPLELGWHFWESSGKRRTLRAVSMKRQGTEVVNLLWSYVPCGRLEKLTSRSTRVDVVVDV